jgi:hypothetical protein
MLQHRLDWDPSAILAVGLTSSLSQFLGSETYSMPDETNNHDY